MNLGQLGAVVALGVDATDPASRGPAQILGVTLAGALATFAVLAVLAPRLLRLDLRRLFRAPRLPELRFAAQAAVALWLVSILVNLANIAVFGPNPQPLVVTFAQHRGPAAIALDLIAGALVAPTAEETLYRGILFAGLAQRMPFAAAASLSAFLFGIVHGLGVLLPIFALSVGLAWVYQRTGTLWAPIVAHALVNAISLGVLFASRPI